MTNYKSDVKLGELYREKHTGLEGKAVAIYFFENACERVSLRYLHDGDIKDATFDAVELESVKTRKTPAVTRPGGPARESGVRPSSGGRLKP